VKSVETSQVTPTFQSVTFQASDSGYRSASSRIDVSPPICWADVPPLDWAKHSRQARGLEREPADPRMNSL